MVHFPGRLPSRLRLAVRRLRRRPRESIFAALALALGLGAAAATWAVVDAVLLRPLPGNDDGRLVALIQTRLDDGSQFTVNSLNARTWRRAEQLESVKASRPASWTLASGSAPRRVEGHEVESGYLALLGLDARLGRTFAAAEASELADAVLVSDSFWRTELGGDPNVVGRTIRFAEGPHTVLGVLPPVQRLERLSLGDLWTPLDLETPDDELHRGLRVLARLGDEASVTSAQAELDAVAAALAAERPETNEGWGVTVEPVDSLITGRVRGPLLSLLAVVGVVLLVALATVGSLGIARALDRRGETSLRRALGARSGDLAASWLVEWALVGVVGGLLGLVPGTVGLKFLASFLDPRVPRIEDATMHPGVLLLVLAAAVVVGLAVGALGLPTLLGSRRSGLASGERASTGDAASGRTLAALVSAQTALSVMALVSALLLGRSLLALGDSELGFEPDGLVAFRLDLPPDRQVASKEERLAIWRALLDRLEALPGVEHAAIATSVPLSGRAGVLEVWVEGREATHSATPEVRALAQIASDDVLDALGVELLAGRGFEDGETWDRRQVVLVNRAFAREHLEVGAADLTSALGRRLRWQSGDVAEIAGVVDDVRQVALHREAEPEIYLAWGMVQGSQTVLVRTANDAPIMESVRRTVAEALPGAPVHGLRTGEQLVAGELAQQRLLASLSAAFAVLAQVLALVGLFGVVAGRVARARRDLAVRMALGARGPDIRRWTLRVALLPVALGAALGLGMAWAGSGLLESQLYGVAVLDPASYLLAGCLAVAGSALVAQVPASKAAGMDPARTLRETG